MSFPSSLYFQVPHKPRCPVLMAAEPCVQFELEERVVVEILRATSFMSI